eukprot:TRINITY_DN62383_c0_g1_i1.p1 TRINITY_DN62383_c0_g1~~TRINITY_DN62383_c0_g1_i1.p1  ORF type:complete len:523 (+),score=70.28 TRINITY_DN62383_c0_g1_i1:72-1640(+)
MAALHWIQSPDGVVDEAGSCITATADKSCTFFANVVLPPVGSTSWTCRFQGTSAHRLSFWEVGISLEGGDVSSNSVSIQCAPENSRVQTAGGVAADGDVRVSLDMDVGRFTIDGIGEGLTCALTCEEKDPRAAITGVGAIRGHLWRPFVRCSRSQGLNVNLMDFKASGRADGQAVAMAFGAGVGDPAASQWLRQLVPGSGGQPGPGIGDIQCVLPPELDNARGGLYISGAAAATLRNLDMIRATAVLRLGSRVGAYEPLPDHFSVKMVVINDDEDSDISPHIDSMNGFLEEHLVAQRNVLVHCGAGVSRSGAAVVAYLMLAKTLRFEEALVMAKRTRDYIRPNDAFKLQLELYEARLAEAGHYGDNGSTVALSGVGEGFGDVQCVRSPSAHKGGLYISGAAGASLRNMSLLTVKALLRLGSFTVAPHSGVDCRTLDLDDSDDADLVAVLQPAVDFASRHRNVGHNCLVHCGAGISRSAAVVAAVLMRDEKMDAEEAMKAVKAARPWASPNLGFQRQLREWTQ